MDVLRKRRRESKDKGMQEYILLGSVHACLMEVVCYYPCEAVAVLRAELLEGSDQKGMWKEHL